MPLIFGGKTVLVKVLAHDAEGGVVGVECVSASIWGGCVGGLGSYAAVCRLAVGLLLFFPQALMSVREVVELADEVWVTGKNGTVEQMMFMSVFHKG